MTFSTGSSWSKEDLAPLRENILFSFSRGLRENILFSVFTRPAASMPASRLAHGHPTPTPLKPCCKSNETYVNRRIRLLACSGQSG